MTEPAQNRLEAVSTIVGFVSLIVSCAGAVFALLAWQHPRPIDPRSIPSFVGDAQLDAGDRGREFIEFLERNEGRLVRIAIRDVSTEVEVQTSEANSMEGTGLSVPYSDCTSEGPDLEICWQHFVMIERESEEILTGLDYSAGWRMNGYYANSGLVAARQGVETYRLDAVDLVDALT
jgi:hypothetical protein